MPADPLGPDALDFWLGEWDLTWGTDGTGTNRIERAAGGRVILETFSGRDSDSELLGMSVSVRVGDGGPWRQTWVDSAGSYLDLVGVLVDDRISFERSTEASGTPVIQRMVWLEVEPNSLRWEWQRSVDGRQTWETVWAIEYRHR